MGSHFQHRPFQGRVGRLWRKAILGPHRPPVAIMFWQDDRRIAALPVVTAADADGHTGQYFRVEGPAVSGPVYWARRG
ncbi:MAG: hypothetical protein QOE52_3795 [Mycobacterium sp.]|nr:hypothetical protein [Mycobacterium sp.]